MPRILNQLPIGRNVSRMPELVLILNVLAARLAPSKARCMKTRIFIYSGNEVRSWHSMPSVAHMEIAKAVTALRRLCAATENRISKFTIFKHLAMTDRIIH